MSSCSSELSITLHANLPTCWDDLVASSVEADFFHTSAWTPLAARCHGHLRPFWFTASLGDQVVGGLAGLKWSSKIPVLGQLHRLESSLEGVSGGPVLKAGLSAEDQKNVFQYLVWALQKAGDKGLARCSISLNTAQEKQHGALLKKMAGWDRRSVPGAVINIQSGLDEFEMTRMKKNKRNERNRGLKRGVEAFVTNEVKWIQEYYPIYQAASETWGISPVPLDFLKGLLELGPEQSFFTCVVYEGKVIGGHLNLVHRDRVMAWNGVTDPAFARDYFPATIAVWQDATEACRRQAGYLDLGASGEVVSLEGFKKNFGAEMEERGFYVLETSGLKRLSRIQKFIMGPKSKSIGEARRWHDDPEKS